MPKQLLLTKQVALTLAILVTAGAAIAQSGRPPPIVKVLRNNKVVPSPGAAFAPKATLLVSPNPACTDGVSYQFKEAEVTLMRGRGPLTPTKLVHRPVEDLTWMNMYRQPGDRIYVFISCKNLIAVSADGKQRSYPQPKQPQPAQPDLRTDAAKGISFSWLLLK